MTTVGEIFDLPADEQYPDDNRGPLLLRVVWILLGLSSIAVAARTYVKIRTTRRVYWDDGLMILAWVCGPFSSGGIPSRWSSLTSFLDLWPGLLSHGLNVSQVRLRKASRIPPGRRFVPDLSLRHSFAGLGHPVAHGWEACILYLHPLAVRNRSKHQEVAFLRHHGHPGCRQYCSNHPLVRAVRPSPQHPLDSSTPVVGHEHVLELQDPDVLRLRLWDGQLADRSFHDDTASGDCDTRQDDGPVQVGSCLFALPERGGYGCVHSKDDPGKEPEYSGRRDM